MRELTISGAYSKNPILIILERKNVGAAEVLRFSFAEAIRLNHALTQVIKQIKEGGGFLRACRAGDVGAQDDEIGRAHV